MYWKSGKEEIMSTRERSEEEKLCLKRVLERFPPISQEALSELVRVYSAPSERESSFGVL